MAFCSDSTINYLDSLGYSVVRIPRKNVNPLDLIGRDHDRMRLGTLDQLLKNPGAALPKVAMDELMANISGKSTQKLKIGIGVNILGDILNALAGSTLGIKSAYEKAKTVEFQFKDVLKDSVEPLAVGKYLRDAEVDVDNPVLKRYVLGRGQLFLVVETIKSKSITVKAEGSSGASIDLDVPAINGIASGKLDADTSKASSGEVTYTGQEPLVFGFKSMRVIVKDGTLDVRDVAPNDISLAMGSTAVDEEGAELFEFEDGALDG